MHVDLVKKLEGRKLVAYQDVAGVWTIGDGHTGPDVYPGMTITNAEADELLARDLAWAEAAVDNAVKVPIDAEQRAALISLTYNIGAGAFQSSTLLRKLNAGDKLGAANEFPRWNKAGGRVIQGLVNRREQERALFMTNLPATQEGSASVAEGGEQKPLPQSKTINTALVGTVLSGLSSVAAAVNGMDWRVAAVFVVVGGLFAYLAFNRFLEWRSGEH